LRKLIIVAAATAVIAAGCGDSGGTTTTETGDGTTTTAETPIGGSLTIYSGRAEELVGPLIERFEQETGVDVSVRYAGSTELAATLVEEGDASPADVFFAQDPASLGTVAIAGMLQVLPQDIIGLVPTAFSDTDGRWVGVSGRSRVVVYDPTTITPDELPATEDGFTDPEWEGRVALAPTNASFLAFVAAKIILDGEDATLTWLQGMVANRTPTFEGNSPIVAAVNEGQVEAGLVNHYYLLQRRAEDPNVVAENHFLSTAGAGSLVMPAGAGILSTTQNQAAAEAFVGFLLAEESQQYFATETFEYPLLPGVPSPEGLPALDSLAAPDIDLSELAQVLDRATELVAESGLL
jgi:iron(III) transport system substrate-binding protein